MVKEEQDNWQKMSPRGQTSGGGRGTGQLAEAAREQETAEERVAEAARSTCGLWLPGSGRKRGEWTPRVHGCCGTWQGTRRGSPPGGCTMGAREVGVNRVLAKNARHVLGTDSCRPWVTDGWTLVRWEGEESHASCVDEEYAQYGQTIQMQTILY